jgi:predicted site-specific integrase-resolvase
VAPKLYRAQEVCDLAQVQPYVLRSWEAEFQDLGVAKVQGGRWVIVNDNLLY